MTGFSGYEDEADVDRVEEREPLAVNSCGYYRLTPPDPPEFRTCRPQGRRDYQLLYVTAGAARFRLGSPEGSGAGERVLGEGGLVIYRPGELQDYSYLAAERPEVYWLHFSGAGLERRLAELGLGGTVFSVPYQEEFPALFRRIIRELQLRRPRFRPLAAACLQELLLLLARGLEEDGERGRSARMGPVVERMHRDFASPRTVEDYARECGVSAGWFIRSFKACTGQSPQQFLIRLRIGKARELLASSSYNISEVAALVGYDNPLYFSRIFRRNVGLSPREYRADRQAKNDSRKE